MKYEIIIDGDNISIERYFTDVLQIVNEITKNCEKHTTIICQSNLTFKYVSQRTIDFSLRCCKTQNKNATDANILFWAGRYVAEGCHVIIVSNDKIYIEISGNTNVSIVGYMPPENQYNVNKLRKKTIIQTINDLKKTHGTSYDVSLDTLLYYFPRYTRREVRKYIESLKMHGVIINACDVVYINEELKVEYKPKNVASD